MSSNKSMKELSVQHSINLKTLYGWVSNYKKENKIIARSIKDARRELNNIEPSVSIIDSLKKECDILRHERDILMNIAAYIIKKS